MNTGCGPNSCGIPQERNKNPISDIKFILTHPSSKCPIWNAFVIAIILVVFGQVVYYDFIFYDDFNYTVGKIDKGNVWTYSFLRWAFTSTDDGFWAPITKISHRIDTHLFGNKAGGHHAMNLLFHIINTLILWRFLCKITKGDNLIPFLAVCLFAVHPLRVEPVVWIASRKDLLSLFFILLMLMKYMDWQNERKKGDYLLTLCFFVCSAMSKPVSVVFPLFLPLLDVLLRKEKILDVRKIFFYVPFFIISVFLVFITLHAEQEAIIPVTLSLGEKISRIIVSTALYFLLTFFPIDLHVPYGIKYFPFFGWTQSVSVYDRTDILVVSSIIIFLFCSVWILFRKQYKSNIVSLAFFLIPLAPVIGFIPFGHHLIADRFTYVPHVGLSLFICTAISGCRDKLYTILNTILSVIIVLFSIISLLYIPLWEYNEKLFRNTLKYEPDNYIALCNVGYALIKQNRYTESIPLLKKAIEVYSLRAGPYNDLAFSYQALGRYKEALELYNKSLQISGDDPEILSNVAYLFYMIGNYNMSKEYAEKALKISPELVNAKKILEMIKQRK